MEPAVRIERTTSRLQGERIYLLSYAGALVLCHEVAGIVGLEPTAFGFGDRRSAN